MKISAIILLMLTPIVAFAQNPPGMNEGDMKNMMQQMQKMQSCMAKIDQKKIQGLEQRTNQFMEAVQSLCANGKWGEAQEKAISFAKEMENSTVMKTMKKCGDMMKDMMPEMSHMDQFIDDPNQHVCDEQSSM